MSVILGWSEGFHDAAVAVLDGDEIVFASHSERFSKVKHDKHICDELKEYVESNFDIDHKAFYEKPLLKKSRQFFAGQFKTVFRKRQMAWKPNKTWHHHLSHAAAAFQTSPYEEAAAVVIDSIGEWDTFTIWKCSYDKNGYAKYSKKMSYQYPKSIGLWYTALTDYVGLRPLDEEYIFMGMAAYGSFNEKLESVLRTLLEENINLHKGVPRQYKELLANYDDTDIAYTAQVILEEKLTNIFTHARKYSDNIVYGGGVALNCVANGKLIQTVAPELWIMPNPGDAGGALGAACLSYGKKVKWRDAYLGYNIKKSMQKRRLAKLVVKHLLDHKICGVAVDEAEFGPRALGNRSLLADPRGPSVKDRVNEIKRRQKFRPFAPVILEEHAKDYCSPRIKSHYMSYVVDWTDTNTPAVKHKDGTARVQTVPRGSSFIRAVLEEWYAATGCPVLLNTSLNIRGEPMVNDLEDAKRFEEKYNVRVFS